MGADERRALKERLPVSVGCVMHNIHIGPLTEARRDMQETRDAVPELCRAPERARA